MENLIVIKIGSNIIFGNKEKVNIKVLKSIIRQICKIKEKGNRVILVSSGAVAVGQGLLKSNNYSTPLLASVGQTVLINYFQKIFAEQNQIIAQILLTKDDFLDRQRYNFIHKTLVELLENNIVPIINENDVVTHNYWGFGENDFLATLTAINISADKIIFLTNVDGIYNKDPQEKDAKLITEIKDNKDASIKIKASDVKSTFGKGGILSKINAAYLSASAGIEAYIINGLNGNNLEEIILNNQKQGTHIKAVPKKLNQKRGWLFAGKLKPGKIIIDRGASKAIRKGKSLLAVGIKEIKGEFYEKDVVTTLDQRNNIIGYGITNYNSKTLAKLKNLENDKIKEKYKRVVIHCDNLAILKK